MAIKPTIYKLRVNLSDLNRDYYDTLNLTVALHPSETAERMMARLIAYCINAQADLHFTKGLSDVDEPDIWVRGYDEQTNLWIEVGEPSLDRIKKAARSAPKSAVYSFNSKSSVWWQSVENKINQAPISVYQINWPAIQQMATFIERTMDMSVTITGDSAYVACAKGECEVGWVTLKE
ncbi:YaeQ family protein [Alteromonadaceae bacterium BrNp21-10]|nr:YaeQ family protein [Alteromonadaceae bacterium BrNp21-10]